MREITLVPLGQRLTVSMSPYRSYLIGCFLNLTFVLYSALHQHFYFQNEIPGSLFTCMLHPVQPLPFSHTNSPPGQGTYKTRLGDILIPNSPTKVKIMNLGRDEWPDLSLLITLLHFSFNSLYQKFILFQTIAFSIFRSDYCKNKGSFLLPKWKIKLSPPFLEHFLEIFT